jgi:hypothetical protein
MTPAQQAALDEYLAAVQGYSQYTPEQLKAAELGASSLQGVTYDPKMLEYEMSALRALEEQGREGLTAQDRAAMAQFERETGQAARGRRGAIEQSMRQRGISGSGLDLVSQLQSAESANELAAMKALEREGLSAQRRTQGQLSAGQMAGKLGERQYQTAADKAAAQDRIAQFNAQNRMNAQQYNIGMGAQTAANRMQAQTGGAQMKYNAAAEAERARLMREEERRRKRQGALSAGLGVLGAAGGAYFGGPAGAGAGYQIGSGLGNAIQGYADGGRVQPYGLGLNLPQPSDTVPAMLTPGEMVLPVTASQSPDAAAAYVDAYNKAEQDVASAKQMRDVLSYADIAAKGLSDYAQSQAPTTYLPRRFEELGRGPEAFQRQMPQYQAGSLAQLGEAGVSQAKEGMASAKEKFGIDTAMEKYKEGKEYDNPDSPVSQRANLLVKARLSALANEADMAKDPGTAKMLRELSSGANMSANQAMQTLKLTEGIDYKNALAAIAAGAKEKAVQAKENTKEAKAEKKDTLKLSIDQRDYVNKISKDNIDIQNRYQAALQLAATPTGVNDEAILVYFQKILDPGSVVREGEFARTKEGQSVISQAQGYVTRLTSGVGLTKEMRSNVLKTMGILAQASQASLDERLKSEKAAAQRYGLDEELIFGSQGQKKPLPAPHGNEVIQNGVKYKWNGFEYIEG